MDAASILSQIRPCDRDNPYIFISYNAQDYQLVYEDTLTLQKLGYNVWLDERNLDKTKPSWTEDALDAISDIDCALLLFYVSRTSLTSEPCFRELNQTVAEQTMRIHFGPVRFVAVDAENVGNISDFAHRLHNEVTHRKDISKQERTSRAIVLSRFCTEFFALNNERVRIHPKNELERKSYYYADLVAAFPEETQLYEPTLTLEQLYGSAAVLTVEDAEPAPVEATSVQNTDADSDKQVTPATTPEEDISESTNAVELSKAEADTSSRDALIAQISAQLKRREKKDASPAPSPDPEKEAAPDESGAETDTPASADTPLATAPAESSEAACTKKEDALEPEEKAAGSAPASLEAQIQARLAKRASAKAESQADDETPQPSKKPLTLAEKLRQYMSEKE